MKKSTLWPKNAKQIKGSVAIAELKRAHLIITLLSLVATVVITLSAVAPMYLNEVISMILVVLLLAIGLISLTTIVLLNKATSKK